MRKLERLMLVLAIICSFAVAASAQQVIPATGTTQTPTYPDAGSSGGVNKWGALPTGAKSMGADESFRMDAGQQFNSKWAMKNGNHDLTTYAVTGKTTSWSSGAVAQSRICSFCHTAHDNESEFADRSQLWAHEVPTAFTAYSSPTLQSTPNTTSTSQTAQCLGCHDGTVALSSGNYGTPPLTAEFSVDTGTGATQLTTAGKLSEAALIVPLSRTHPVSFTYDSALAAKHQLRVPANSKSIDGFGLIPLFGTTGTMECATCHDPHIKTGIMRRQFPTGASQDNGTGSFCLYCHL